MSTMGIFQAEFLKTKRSAVRRIAISSPLCLGGLAVIQQGYFSLNLFNWFYVIFLPATFALISGAAVGMEYGRHRLRAVRCLPISQGKIWRAKLAVVTIYALCSCLLLSCAVIVIPKIFVLFGTPQVKRLSVPVVLLGLGVMFLTTVWQIPLCFLLAKRLGLVFTVVVNFALSMLGVFLALKPYWIFYPWAWVDRCMISVVGVLPNGLPAENANYTGIHDVVLAVLVSLILSAALSALLVLSYGKTEAR